MYKYICIYVYMYIYKCNIQLHIYIHIHIGKFIYALITRKRQKMINRNNPYWNGMVNNSNTPEMTGSCGSILCNFSA